MQAPCKRPCPPPTPTRCALLASRACGSSSAHAGPPPGIPRSSNLGRIVDRVLRGVFWCLNTLWQCILVFQVVHGVSTGIYSAVHMRAHTRETPGRFNKPAGSTWYTLGRIAASSRATCVYALSRRPRAARTRGKTRVIIRVVLNAHRHGPPTRCRSAPQKPHLTGLSRCSRAFLGVAGLFGSF